MTLRLLVLNGSKIVQGIKDGIWENQKVSKAGKVKPGIYDLVCTPNGKYTGVTLQADGEYVYQYLSDGTRVAHRVELFSELPDIGCKYRISYAENKITTWAISQEEPEPCF